MELNYLLSEGIKFLPSTWFVYSFIIEEPCIHVLFLQNINVIH